MANLEHEIQECGSCCILCDGVEIPRAKEDWPIFTLKNGMTLGLGHGLGTVPLWSDFLLCPEHGPQAEALWGDN